MGRCAIVFQEGSQHSGGLLETYLYFLWLLAKEILVGSLVGPKRANLIKIVSFQTIPSRKGILIFCGYYNKLPQAWWLSTTHIYPLMSYYQRNGME